ncbi:MAG: hypothetical protein QME64_09310 [bacterium]|nr:hypothetical protein [bacterium]
MAYFSKFYEIEVRDEIVMEFTDSEGKVDDMMAGLHEIRARLAEEDSWIKSLYDDLKHKKNENAQHSPSTIVLSQ